MALQHLRSSTANKRPTPGAMADGQLAINTEATSPGLFFKDSGGNLVKVGPVHVGTTAPNVSPAVGGQAGNTLGEQWLDTSGSTFVFKVWDGSAWRSEAGEFVNVTGDTMTGALVMDNQQQVRFRETTANGTNYIALQAPAAVSADVTFTLPGSDGTSGQALSTNGTGTLGWSSYAGLDTAQTFTKGQRAEVTALTDAATISVDFSDSNNFSVTLGGNRTLGNPTNQVAGQSGSLFITQDGTGSRTLAYSSDWEFAGGTAPTLSTTASATDRIDYIVRASGSIHAVLTKAFS